MFIIVTLIANQRNGGDFTPVATLKLFVSSFNFAFNLLDMFLPVVNVKPIEDGDADDNEEAGDGTEEAGLDVSDTL